MIMQQLPEVLLELVKNLAKLPGVGTKSAQRFAFFLLDMKDEDALAVAQAITNAKQQIHACPVCGSFTASLGKCEMCVDEKRNSKVVCVVSSARDVFYMNEIQNGFDGKFHVLGGVLSPIDGVGPDDLNIKTLVERVSQDGVEEVIIATNPDIEGEATASYIAMILKPLGVRVSRLAYGLPMGSNLEYVDALTLSMAIDGRREM